MPWRPVRQNHSIERVAISFAFEDELPLKVWNKLQQEVSGRVFPEGFARVADPHFQQSAFHQVIQIQLNPGPQPFVQSPELAIFRSTRDNQIVEEIVVGRTLLVYTSSSYSRWRAMKGRMASLLEAALQISLEITNLASMKLEYWDRFIFHGPTEEVRYSDALRRNSDIIPSFYEDMSDFWHSHIGYFEAGAVGQKRLINANVDVVEAFIPGQDGPSEPMRSIGIYTLAEDRHTPTLAVPRLEVLWAQADGLHEALKVVFSKLISQELADSISLKLGNEP